MSKEKEHMPRVVNANGERDPFEEMQYFLKRAGKRDKLKQQEKVNEKS